MRDTDWRELERASDADPGDVAKAERAILACRRAGEAAPLALLDRYAWPALEAFGAEAEAKRGAKPKDLAAGRAILEGEGLLQACVVSLAFFRLDRFYGCRQAIGQLCSLLLRRRGIPLTEADLVLVIEGAGRAGGITWAQPWKAITRQVELLVAHEGLGEKLAERLRLVQTEARAESFRSGPERRDVLARLKALVDAPLPDAGPVANWPFLGRDHWIVGALKELQSLPPKEQHRWHALLVHAETATASNPSKKWLKTAGELIDALGRERFLQVVVEWLRDMREPPIQLERGQTMIKGIVWAAGSCEGSQTGADALGAVAVRAFEKIPDRGPRAPRIGNACVRALAGLGEPGLAKLRILGEQVTHTSSRKSIKRALDAGPLR